MDIKNIFGGSSPYTQSKVDKGDESAAASKVDKAKAKAKSQTSGKDRVSVSDDAKLVAEAAKAAQESPDIRVERVEALRSQVQAGTYNLDSRRIAQKLVESDLEFLK